MAAAGGYRKRAGGSVAVEPCGRFHFRAEALRCDMPMALISQALGHSSEKTTRFYLEELDISRLAHANMKVIGSVNRILEKRMDGL